MEIKIVIKDGERSFKFVGDPLDIITGITTSMATQVTDVFGTIRKFVEGED